MALKDTYAEYEKSAAGQRVASMNDAQTQATLGGLKAAYDQNLSDKQAEREKIGQTYQTAGNDMQAQYERNRRNLNQQAAANGINTGAGSQQQLALQNVWNRDYGTLRGQEAQAYTEADRAIADLGVQYRAAVQQAQAEGDYRKMAALLDNYNTERQQALQQASLLAGFGNFSGYEGIFDSDQINSMRESWIAQNPLLAYNTGAITADQYYKMTGQYAPGAGQASTSYGGSGGNGGYSSLPTRLPSSTNGSQTTGANQLAANGKAIIDMAARAGTSAENIDRAVQQAVAAGLIPAGEATSVAAQAKQASGANNPAHGPTWYAQRQQYINDGVWTPSLGAQFNYTQEDAARAQQQKADSRRSAGGR